MNCKREDALIAGVVSFLAFVFFFGCVLVCLFPDCTGCLLPIIACWVSRSIFKKEKKQGTLVHHGCFEGS